MNNSFLLALSTLIGTIVGAGIFGLPYVVSQIGIIPSILYFIGLGAAVLLLHLCFGEIALRTKEKYRLIGYAQKYLGPWAKNLATFSTTIGGIGALLAYMILGGNFLAILFNDMVPGISEFTFSIVFWAGLSVCILFGIRVISRIEFFMDIALFAAVGIILLFALPHVRQQHFVLFDGSSLFFPFGVILFALIGTSAIPEIAELFKNKKDRRNLDNVIVWTSMIILALYLAFAFVIAGVSGGATTQNALAGLAPILGDWVIAAGAVFGLIAIAGSFLVLGNYLKNSLRYDYKLPHGVSAGIAITAPVLLFWVGLREFIGVIGIAGAIMGAFEGVLILLIYVQARRKGDREPEYKVRLPYAVFFLAGAILVAGALAELAGKF